MRSRSSTRSTTSSAPARPGASSRRSGARLSCSSATRSSRPRMPPSASSRRRRARSSRTTTPRSTWTRGSCAAASSGSSRRSSTRPPRSSTRWSATPDSRPARSGGSGTPAARAPSRRSARSCGRSCPTRSRATPRRSPALPRDSPCQAWRKPARSKMRDRAMRRLIPYVAAIVGVALTSVFIGLVVGRTQLANISMLYLVAVLLVAVAFGRAAAIAASLLAFLTFDWFFVPPTHQLVVADAEELFSLALFLMTAVVTGTLAARERARAEEAKAREREATLLYEAAFLMAEPDLERALVAVAEHVRAALDLDAVSIEADADILPHPAIAARDDAARADLRATGSELRLMDPAGPSRTIRLVGPTTARAGRRARLVPIVAAGVRV